MSVEKIHPIILIFACFGIGLIWCLFVFGFLTLASLVRNKLRVNLNPDEILIGLMLENFPYLMSKEFKRIGIEKYSDGALLLKRKQIIFCENGDALLKYAKDKVLMPNFYTFILRKNSGHD